MSLQRANAVIRIELGPERLILLQNVENVAQHLQANGVLGRNYCCAARIEAHAGHFAEEIAGAKFGDGRPITGEIVRQVIRDEKSKLQGSRKADAAAIYEEMMTSAEFPEFLTLVAYEHID